MIYAPTQEQENAMTMFGTGEDMVIEAGAGTGKTSTLILIADTTEKRGQYVAFNKAIVEEAKAKMPSNVACNTAHSLAYAAIMTAEYKDRMNRSARMPAWQIAKFMGMDDIVVSLGEDESRLLPRNFLASLVMRSIGFFCQSADEAPSEHHIPYIEKIDVPNKDGQRGWKNNNEVRKFLLPYMQDTWESIQRPHGWAPFKHEHYLKMWQLSKPIMNADFVLFDEAQDANPVMLAAVLGQKNAQKILVGDSQQQIYEWTGAVNALQSTGIENRTYLSQSFRFGPAIADMANGVLSTLDAPLRLRGTDSIPSRIGYDDRPDCFLTRTNARAVRRVLDELSAGRRPYLVGGGTDIISFAKAAQKLMNGQATEHNDLACFVSWNEVREYVANDPNGEELRLNVKLIDDFTPEVIIDQLGRMPKEENASIIISTSHKAKGREWNSVQLADDFPKPKEGDGLPRDEELRLLYVAETRAKLTLDPYACKLAMLIGSAPMITSRWTVQYDDETDETDETVSSVTIVSKSVEDFQPEAMEFQQMLFGF